MSQFDTARQIVDQSALSPNDARLVDEALEAGAEAVAQVAQLKERLAQAEAMLNHKSSQLGAIFMVLKSQP